MGNENSGNWKKKNRFVCDRCGKVYKSQGSRAYHKYIMRKKRRFGVKFRIQVDWELAPPHHFEDDMPKAGGVGG